jgi:A/G-specific adenine glycosylase
LRSLGPADTLSLGKVGAAIKHDYSAADEPWLQSLVTGLAHDGLLATREDATISLP